MSEKIRENVFGRRSSNLAYYGEDLATEKFKKQKITNDLFEFFQNHIITNFKEFLQNSCFFNLKKKIEYLNLKICLLEKIKHEEIYFKTEIDGFFKNKMDRILYQENKIFIIKSIKPYLTLIRVYQYLSRLSNKNNISNINYIFADS